MASVAEVPTGHSTSISRGWLTALLASGIACAVVQVTGDVLAATRYPGYRYVDQAVSELSAIGAPTRSFLFAVGLMYQVLVVAFAVGVWKASGRRRSMRTTAVLLSVYVLNAFIWTFFPMQQRGAETSATDIAHAVMAAVQVLTIVLFIAFGSGADGRWFRIFSMLMIAAILAGGGVAATQVSAVAEGAATPWLGLIERVSFYGPSLWILALAIVLLRDVRSSALSEDTALPTARLT